MKMNIYKRKKGFTLIELLVATTIIIVLTTIGVVSFTNAGVSARNSKRKSDIESVRQALVLYRSDGNNYPYGLGGTYSSVTSTLVSGGYLAAPAPTDPKSGNTPYGYVGSGGTTFCVCATMEGTNKGNAGSMSVPCNFGTGNLYCAASP